MVAPAQRHGELIAHLASECAVLREPQVMGVRGSTATYQARLIGYELDVLLVAKAAGLGMDQPALVDNPGAGQTSQRLFRGCRSTDIGGRSAGEAGDNAAFPGRSAALWTACHRGLERVLQQAAHQRRSSYSCRVGSYAPRAAAPSPDAMILQFPNRVDRAMRSTAPRQGLALGPV